jgi:hypothetical protein
LPSEQRRREARKHRRTDRKLAVTGGPATAPVGFSGMAIVGTASELEARRLIDAVLPTARFAASAYIADGATILALKLTLIRPMSTTLGWPCTSPNVPAIGVATAIVSTRPVMAHVMVTREAPRSAPMSSSATVINVISEPNAVTASITMISRRCWSRRSCAKDGGGVKV